MCSIVASKYNYILYLNFLWIYISSDLQYRAFYADFETCKMRDLSIIAL